MGGLRLIMNPVLATHWATQDHFYDFRKRCQKQIENHVKKIYVRGMTAIQLLLEISALRWITLDFEG